MGTVNLSPGTYTLKDINNPDMPQAVKDYLQGGINRKYVLPGTSSSSSTTTGNLSASDIATNALNEAQITPEDRQNLISSRRGQLASELQSATGNIDPYSGVQRGGVQRTAEGYGVQSANAPINIDIELKELQQKLAGTASGVASQQSTTALNEQNYEDTTAAKNAEIAAENIAANQAFISGANNSDFQNLMNQAFNANVAKNNTQPVATTNAVNNSGGVGLLNKGLLSAVSPTVKKTTSLWSRKY